MFCRTIKKNAVGTLLLASLFLSSCSTSPAPAAPAQATQSIYTRLSGPSCKNKIDKDDPNEIPYLVCRGVPGYELSERNDDIGRAWIIISDAAHHTFAINYPSMSDAPQQLIDDQVEWRVAANNGKQVAVALITRISVPKDHAKSPEDHFEFTNTYLVIVKITPNKACITDIIPEGTQPMDKIRGQADLAQNKPCISRRPQP